VLFLGHMGVKWKKNWNTRGNDDVENSEKMRHWRKNRKQMIQKWNEREYYEWHILNDWAINI
jgi:hypothetical protein